MNDKATFSIAVGLSVVSISASLLTGTKLWELAPSIVVMLSSLVLLKRKNSSLS